jgi:outer membrane protein assembly factor BamB
MIAVQNIRAFYFGLYLLALAGFSPANAQQLGQGTFMSDAALRSIGLERAWNTQVEFDSAKGRLAGLAVHVARDELVTYYEAKHSAFGRYAVSERDLNTLAQPMGKEAAKAKVEQWVKNWKEFHPAEKDIEVEVKTFNVPQISLAVSAQRGMVQLINAETGLTYWNSKIGSEFLPTTPPALNNNHVAVLNGSKLYLLKRKDGSIEIQRQTINPPGGGPGMSSKYVYIPMINGIVETYSLENLRHPPSSIGSHGRIFQQPAVFYDAVAWTTDRGLVYVANAEATGLRFRIATSDVNSKTGEYISKSSNFTPGIPTFLFNGENKAHSFYFGTAEGYVYSCNADYGNVTARFSAGEPILSSPIVVQGNVYAISEAGSLYCMTSDTLMEKWWQPGMKQVLAGSENRVYVVDRYQNLVAFEADTGSRIGSVPIGNIDLLYTNVSHDRIFLGTTTGVIQCLRESNRNFPWVHLGMKVKKKFAQILNEPQNANPNDEPMPEMKEDAPAANPFDAPPAAEMKEEKKPAVDDNPFD